MTKRTKEAWPTRARPLARSALAQGRQAMVTTFKVPRGCLFSTEEVVAVLAQAVDAVKEGRKVVIVLVDPRPVQLDD